MVKLAADTAPVVAGKVTPPAPPVVRVPAGESMAAPGVVTDTAILPKFMSMFFMIEMGVITEAVTVVIT